MRHLSWLTLIVPLLLAPVPAFADDAVTQARQRFVAGKQAYGEGRYKDAVALFLQANTLDPHAELLFNVGQAYEKLDDVGSALRVFREYLRLLPNAADRALVEEKDRKFEARLRERGVQQVTIFSRPPGATLILDDRAVGAVPWTGEIAPGRHVAVLKAPGFADAKRDFVLAPDRAMDVDVELSRPAGAAPPVAPEAPVPPVAGPIAPGIPPEAPPQPPVEAPKPRVAPWTIAALSLGVVGFGAAIGLEIARESSENAAKGDPTQLGYQSALSQMTTRQTAARAFVGIGAAATVAGGVLLVLDLRRHGPEASPPKAGIACFSGACGAFASGRF